MVNYYGNVHYNTSKWDVSLLDWHLNYANKYKSVIEHIRLVNQVDPKHAKEIKTETLPCVSITGHFPTYRQVQRADRFNPIICIDIDKGDNPEITDWEELKCKLIELPYIVLTSLSCRGEGIYCYAYFDLNLDFKKVWYALERDFKEMGIRIDKNCKDITRLRFISYDSNIKVRKEVEPYNKEYDKEAEYQVNYTNDSSTWYVDDSFTFKAINHLITKCNYRSNDYYSWLQDGFRLATLGNQFGKILFMMLSQLSEGYNEAEALHKFNECVRSSRKTKSCLAYYFARLKEYYGDDWRTKIQ